MELGHSVVSTRGNIGKEREGRSNELKKLGQFNGLTSIKHVSSVKTDLRVGRRGRFEGMLDDTPASFS